MARAAQASVGLALLLLSACTEDGSEPAVIGQAERDALTGWIYFLESDPGDEHPRTRVVRVRPNGEDHQPVTGGDAPAFAYAPSPDGRHLPLTVDDDLVLARPDGSGARRVASSPGLEWYPRYSPDGRWVLFESSRASFRDLYKLSVATGDVVRLTDDPEGNFDAAWSPDGARIAFASSRTGQLDLWVMNADGTRPRRLTRHAGDSIKPAWSPSGELIAFISARDGVDDLFVIEPDGEGLTKLTRGSDGEAHVRRFAWHPTEDRIVYQAQRLGENNALYVVDVVTKQRRRLSQGGDDDREPAWSPDGEHIAFASERDGGSDVYLMRADGSRRTRLTAGRRHAWLPRWFRVDEGRDDT